jgi:hypothetical protein
MRTPHRAVTTVTPATGDPVSLSEAKAYAKIDTDADDALIMSLITAATVAAENYTRRSFITRTLKLTLDAPCNGLMASLPEGTYDLPITIMSGDLPSVISLPQGPLQAVSSIVTYDVNNSASTFAPSNYLVDTASSRVSLNYGAIWPSNLRSLSTCEITYTAGYGDASSNVPQPIRTAILMHVQKMYTEREVCDMPDNCTQLLDQYKQWSL